MKDFVQVSDSVTWTGVIDQDMKKFHGEELSIPNGTSYNSYLVKDEKTVLIDTVIYKKGYEWVSKLKKEIDLKEIDYIVMNHSEPDHSGGLLELMREIPETPIVCTEKGMEILKKYYGKNWNFQTVKTGDKLNIGSKELIFVEMKMLHWPDSMLTYLTEENILFSNDAFGQHYANYGLFNDMADQDQLNYECMKYYACILTPFSGILKNKLEEVLALDLKIDMICPSHGVIWRDNPLQIVQKYLKWCNSYSESQVTIVYDTMWESTRKMAESIAEGISDVRQDIRVKLYNSGKNSENDIATEIFRSEGFLLGSSTINNGVLPSMSALMESIKGLKFTDKKVGAFGSYGWNGKSLDIINQGLDEMQLERISDGIKTMWNLDDEDHEKCKEFGREFANSLFVELL
ncbi:MBL fold metallo-hydrolase [uncultured Ilyobacter sp.]|uniref:MBL fold metallo-hydrolase n=1 Tax=uncultured Ilyobacter sp. TaxID=544433 RepID=UPI002AA744C7|nr:MBL fold metallo-hydrolase [uncultured Ilyobacter sp.]